MKITKVQRIVSISILVLIMLMLIAVSYAYFTARVEGNKEAKEIKVDAAIMSVKLTGPEEITAENLIPSQSTSIKFQVENTGTVPAIYNLDMIEVINDFDPTSDLVYTITSTNNGGHVQDKEAPDKNQTLVRNILIKPGKENIQKYTLTLLFKETEINQDTNQNKTFEGRVQINNLEDNTMATRIIRTNKLQTNEPDFTHASPEEVNGVTTDYGSGIFAAEDDDGTSYYFRGAVENNNVHFADMDWKILRVNGDGSIRLILNNSIEKMVFSNLSPSLLNNNADADKPNVSAHGYEGYTYNNEQHCTSNTPCISDYDPMTQKFANEYGGVSSAIKDYLENTWYKTKLVKYDEYISLATYCNDTSFGALKRVYGNTNIRPYLKCPDPIKSISNETYHYGGVYKLKIGLPSADELNMAGYKSGGFRNTLFKEGDKIGDSQYLQKLNNIQFWTMSPAGNDSSNVTFFLAKNGGLMTYDVPLSPTNYVVPVINLKPDVSFTTNGSGEPGTVDNPYIIK